MKKLTSTLLILLMVFSMVSFALASNGRVISNQNELENQYRSSYQISTGEFIDVKITQQNAKEQIRNQIRQRLRIQNCSCENIQVVEIKNKQNQLRVAYQSNEEFKGRILGIFNKRVMVQTNLDVETGELISIKKPWYMWMMSFKNRVAN